jgi:hypothetical protein
MKANSLAVLILASCLIDEGCALRMMLGVTDPKELVLQNLHHQT